MIEKMKNIRIERDTLGAVEVPKDAYYGAHTARAIKNFPISGLKPHRVYIESIVVIKKAAALVNSKLKLLDSKISNAIVKACNEILAGKFDDWFVVDPYQAGAGTSLNMNVNEVIANRANELLGAPLGSYKFVHPNDHINMSQSTNDVIPAAIRIAALVSLPKLLNTIKRVEKTFQKKSKEFNQILKAGRTHLQDAMPITLGQELSAYGVALTKDRKLIDKATINLYEIGIGGTAVGTGVNTHPKYHSMMVRELSKLTKLLLKSSPNVFESMQNTADFLDFSSSLRTLAQTLIRIGNDLRLLSSGPRTGLSEIILPEVQPGSSIMPGKINPSIIEMLTMVCFQVIGFDLTILLSSQAGQLELNVMLPLIAYNLLEQLNLLTNALESFNKNCLKGLQVNKEICRFWFERSTGVAALLNPYIGYEKAANLVKLSLQTNRSIKELAIEKGYLTQKKVDILFSVKNLTKPNILASSRT